MDFAEYLKKKPLWKDRRGGSYRFICPQCRSDRWVPLHPRVGMRQAIQIAVASFTLAFFASPWMGWKGLVVFVPIGILVETVHRLRARAALACTKCGFDPYLYLTDVQLARREVESFWRTKLAERGVPWPEKITGKSKIMAATDKESGR